MIKNPHKKIEKAQNFKFKHIEKQKTTTTRASLKITEINHTSIRFIMVKNPHKKIDKIQNFKLKQT
jgi:hypothetical protein